MKKRTNYDKVELIKDLPEAKLCTLSGNLQLLLSVHSYALHKVTEFLVLYVPEFDPQEPREEFLTGIYKYLDNVPEAVKQEYNTLYTKALEIAPSSLHLLDDPLDVESWREFYDIFLASVERAIVYLYDKEQAFNYIISSKAGNA